MRRHRVYNIVKESAYCLEGSDEDRDYFRKIDEELNDSFMMKLERQSEEVNYSKEREEKIPLSLIQPKNVDKRTLKPDKEILKISIG